MKYIDRKLEPLVTASLNYNPVVLINGPRQAGKSTLIQHIQQNYPDSEYITFDDINNITAATMSPVAFLTNNRKSLLILDEIQLVPELFRAIKTIVDEHRLKNKNSTKFLLSGSANIMALPKLADSLVGRMIVTTLYPFANSEIIHNNYNFIEQLFNKNFAFNKINLDLNIIKAIKTATFPGIYQESKANQKRWFNSYIMTILQRDIKNFYELEKIAILPNLLRILAIRAGNLLNYADIARDLGINPVTTKQYRNILELMFLHFEVKPWYKNLGKRLAKSAKGYMIDTLLLCNLLDLELNKIATTKPELFGHIIENFVASELLKSLSTSNINAKLYHYRTDNNKEIDFIIEKSDFSIIGIEVKSREIINKKDFTSLIELQQLIKEQFVVGIVLYLGNKIIPFGENLFAMPISVLWS